MTEVRSAGTAITACYFSDLQADSLRLCACPVRWNLVARATLALVATPARVRRGPNTVPTESVSSIEYL